MSYYTINEEAARTANDLNSHYTYREGSATASYRRQVDEATELAERQKKRVDPMYAGIWQSELPSSKEKEAECGRRAQARRVEAHPGLA